MQKKLVSTIQQSCRSLCKHFDRWVSCAPHNIGPLPHVHDSISELLQQRKSSLNQKAFLLNSKMFWENCWSLIWCKLVWVSSKGSSYQESTLRYNNSITFSFLFFLSQFLACIPSLNISKLYAKSLFQKLTTKAGNIKNILLFKSSVLLKCLRITDRLQNRHFFCLSYNVELYRLILACYFHTCSTPLPWILLCSFDHCKNVPSVLQ